MLRLGLIWLTVSFGTMYKHINRSFFDLDLLIARFTHYAVGERIISNPFVLLSLLFVEPVCTGDRRGARSEEECVQSSRHAVGSPLRPPLATHA